MKTLNLSLMSLCMISLAACGGAKDNLDSLTSGLAVPHTQTPVKGLALDGKWDSGCIKNPLAFGGEGKRRITIQADGSNLEHNVITYADAACLRPYAQQDGARKGTYKFVRAGVVELSMPQSDGRPSLFYFAAARAGDVLKVGELGGLDSASSDTPEIVLEKQAAEVPQGKHSLEAGVYTANPAQNGVRDISISTADVNGNVAQVFIEILRATPTKATLNCDGDTCKGSDGQVDYVLKIKSTRTFEISMPAFNLTVNYVKR